MTAEWGIFIGVILPIGYLAVQALLATRIAVGDRVVTILDREGIVIDACPTHYKIRFDNGSEFWCRPEHFAKNKEIR